MMRDPNRGKRIELQNPCCRCCPWRTPHRLREHITLGRPLWGFGDLYQSCLAAHQFTSPRERVQRFMRECTAKCFPAECGRKAI